jgi:hypothetical protein
MIYIFIVPLLRTIRFPEFKTCETTNELWWVVLLCFGGNFKLFVLLLEFKHSGMSSFKKLYVYRYIFMYLFVEVVQMGGYMDVYILTSLSASSVNTGNMNVY